jgi:hypothetical protein
MRVNLIQVKKHPATRGQRERRNEATLANPTHYSCFVDTEQARDGFLVSDIVHLLISAQLVCGMF